MAPAQDLPDVLDAFCLRTNEDAGDDFSPQLAAMLQGQCMDWDELPPENDEGCIEYKWRLGPEHSRRRVARLATQMKFRLAEGSGTAFYLLGVRDSGFAEGLSAREHSEAVSVLMAAAGAADCILLLEALGRSSRSQKSRCCSVWRLEQRHAAVSKLSKNLHLCGSLADSWQRCRMEVEDPKDMMELFAFRCGQRTQ
ncbi:GTPBP2 [Symbiodinium sp. CCMP2456]|nr:GTPBP2 [Symbiodinium sp. CCMP2456]